MSEIRDVYLDASDFGIPEQAQFLAGADSFGCPFVDFTEHSRFHVEHYPEIVGIIFDGDGDATVRGCHLIEEALRLEHLPDESFNVCVTNSDEDIPGLTIQMTAPLECHDEADMIDVCWSMVAAILNATDPGTFGHTYLMNDAMRIYGEAV